MAATRLYAASALARAVRRSHSWCTSTTTLLRSRQQFTAVQCNNTASVAAVLRQWQQRSVSTLACVRQRAAPQQHGWKEEEEEDEQHGSTDTVKEIAEVANTKGDLVVFKDGKKVHFAGMFAFGLLKNCFWAFIFYLQQTAPEVIDHLSWVWPPIGACAGTVMMLFAYSTATNSVHEIVRMENGVMARISTLNVLGLPREPVEVRIEDLSCADPTNPQGTAHLLIKDAKSNLTIDIRNGDIPNKVAFTTLVQGHALYGGSTARPGARKVTTKPEEWRTAVDPASKKTYWYHPLTRETTWTDPASVKPSKRKARRNDKA